MLAGVWQHHQVFDGTYSFGDLLDIHELLDVKTENERRALEHQERLQRHHGH